MVEGLGAFSEKLTASKSGVEVILNTVTIKDLAVVTSVVIVTKRDDGIEIVTLKPVPEESQRYTA